MSITRKPLLKHCEELLIQELSNISIQRAGNTISIYDVIKNILEAIIMFIKPLMEIISTFLNHILLLASRGLTAFCSFFFATRFKKGVFA